MPAAEWPQWRGPNANGFSPETGINRNWTKKPPAMLWQVSLSDNGYAGPSVAEGKVFIIDHQGGDDVVRALEVRTGNEVWNFHYPDAEKDNYGFSRATPVYDHGKLYTLGRFASLYCLDAQTGAKIWVRELVSEFHATPQVWKPWWNYAMSPLIDGEKIILCPGGPDASVVALNKNTGELIWKGGGSDRPGYATPVLATIRGVKQYVIFAGPSLMGLNAADGTTLWRYPWETKFDVNAATPIVYRDGTIFITSGNDHACALLAITNDGVVKRWENKAMLTLFNSPISYQGYLYGTTDPGDLICLNPTTGEVKWRQPGFERARFSVSKT